MNKQTEILVNNALDCIDEQDDRRWNSITMAVVALVYQVAELTEVVKKAIPLNIKKGVNSGISRGSG